jgi:hypothetical protein
MDIVTGFHVVLVRVLIGFPLALEDCLAGDELGETIAGATNGRGRMQHSMRGPRSAFRDCRLGHRDRRAGDVPISTSTLSTPKVAIALRHAAKAGPGYSTLSVPFMFGWKVQM